ncbi:hypothetical protein BGZ94_000436 [Podila epigama]|nr:hypothetical protein BGZ94_000436 [Podila epigama]
MKTPTVFTTILAVALTASVHAAPATVIPGSATTTSLPQPWSHTPSNGRNNRTPEPFTVTNDTTIFDRVVKYDTELAALLNAEYNSVLYGNNTAKGLLRTNAVIQAAAAQSDLKDFCVGIARNPVRVKIFKDRVTCDIQGWNTLWIFQAHTKYDHHHAPWPMCVGNAENPSRSLLFFDESSCSVSGWVTDFYFYASGQLEGNPDQHWGHESTDMFAAFNPHRMMIYPYYEGEKRGWQRHHVFSYRSRFRPATSEEMRMIQGDLKDHAELHKRTDIARPPSMAHRRAIQNLIMAWDYPEVTMRTPQVTSGMNNADFVRHAQTGGYEGLMYAADIVLHRSVIGRLTSIDIVIAGVVYASATVPINGDLHVGAIRQALQMSVRFGVPMPVARHTTLWGAIITRFRDTFFVAGGNKVWPGDII